VETQIKDSLISLLGAIKAADGKTVASEMARLDDGLARGRGALHPQLVHFLENRSYAKALVFLGGETSGFAGQAANPPGGCSGKTRSTSSGQVGRTQA
jgi:hypothetical protein